jgi:hypothetical protein
MDKQHPEIPTEGQQTPVKTQNDKDAASRFVFPWCSKGPTAGAQAHRAGRLKC